jgi:hypothetical protein
MVRLHRARSDAKRLVTATALLGLAFALTIPLGETWGSPTDADSQQRLSLPAAPGEPFSGEIEYEFDTLLNVTKARFHASLDTHGVLGRMFLSAPAVHTVIATYRFAGRTVNRVPDSVRISFVSDEYAEQVPEERNTMPAARPILELNLGHTLARYGLAVAQRTAWKSVESEVPHRLLPTENHIAQQMPPTLQVRTSRTSTSLLSLCEFLALISEREVNGTVAGLDFALNHRVITGLRVFASEMKSNEVGAANVSCADPLVHN